MNFGLLWLDALLIALLWVAAALAFVGRVKRKWIRVALSIIVVLAPLSLLATFAFAAASMKFSMKIEANWFGYALSLLLSYLVGALLVVRRASRAEPGLPPAMATWRRTPLLLSWLMAAVVGYMVLLNMDLAFRARCAILSVNVNSIYLATLPAISSDAQNAAPLYQRAFANLRDAWAEEEAVQNPPTGNHEDFDFDPDEPATIAFLTHQAPTIALLRRAAALPACRFDSDLFDPDMEATISGLNEERNAANVLNLHAREEIARGHVSSAIDDAAAIIGMSRHVGQRPLLVSALVAVGIGALGDKTIEQALPAVKTKDELAGLHLEDIPSRGRMFQQSLRGEERYGLTLYATMPAMPNEIVVGNAPRVSDPHFLSWDGGFTGAFARAFFLDLDAYVKLMANIQELVTQPYYLVRGQASHAYGLDHGNDLLTSIVAPSLSRAFETLARVEASDACTQVAVAMTRFRLDHGTLPSHLDELVPTYMDAIPIDPFDGHPLRLAIKNDQWIIYSVGPDGVDNGGMEIDHGKGDVIFTLRPARQITTRP